MNHVHEYPKWVTVSQKCISACYLELPLLYRSTPCAYIRMYVFPLSPFIVTFPFIFLITDLLLCLKIGRVFLIDLDSLALICL